MSGNIKSNFSGQIIKGIVTYLIISISLIFIFALILTNANMNNNTIFWINQFIKVICVFTACFLALKGEKGLLKGALVGLLGSIVLYVIFLVFGITKFNFLCLLLELVLSILLGGVFGAITINIKK